MTNQLNRSKEGRLRSRQGLKEQSIPADHASQAAQAGMQPESPLGPYLSPASFRPVEKIVQSAWFEHAPFAFWLVEQCKPNILVELGTHYGFSYFALCQAIRMAGLGTAAYAVDGWIGDEHAGFYGEEVFQSVASYNHDQYANMSTLMRMSFADALPYFEDGSIDLLHIDGRHYLDDVREDLYSWLPKLSDRAVVLLHDTNVRERDFGVHRLWTELAGKYPSFDFIHGHGLGVLGVGSELPPAVAKLLTAGSDKPQRTAVRTAYARLGAGVIRTASEELHRLRDQLAAQREELKAVAARCDALTAELEAARLVTRRHEASLAEKERTIEELAAALQTEKGALTREIEKLARDLEAARVVTRQYEASVAEKEKTVEELTTTLRIEKAALTGEIEKLARELEAARIFLRECQSDLQRVAGERDAAHNELSQAQVELTAAGAERDEAIRRCGELLEQCEILEEARRDARGEADISTHRVDQAEALIRELEGRIQIEAAERDHQTRELERAEEARILIEREAAARIGALQASQATIAANEKRAEEQVHALIGQLVEAEARLARSAWQQRRTGWARFMPGGDRDEAHLLRKSGLFDEDWYRSQYPDAAANGRSLIEHFLQEGYLRGNKPNPLFDPRWYLKRYEDVRRAGVNPAVHYLLHGAREGRDPGPEFKTEFYLSTNSDVRDALVNPLAHYLHHGRYEGRRPAPQ